MLHPKKTKTESHFTETINISGSLRDLLQRVEESPASFFSKEDIKSLITSTFPEFVTTLGTGLVVSLEHANDTLEDLKQNMIEYMSEQELTVKITSEDVEYLLKDF